MAYELDDFYKLGVGDKVRLVELPELSATDSYVSSMGAFAGQVVTIKSPPANGYFNIQEDEHGWNFHRTSIESLVEKNCWEIPMTISVIRKLKAGDRVRFLEYDELSGRYGSDFSSQWAGQVATISIISDNLFTVEEDEDSVTMRVNMLSHLVLRETPVSRAEQRRRQREEEKAMRVKKWCHDVFIKSDNLYCYEQLHQLKLMKITDDVDKIIRYSNKPKIAKIIAGKWVVISLYSDRLYANLNPHIKDTLIYFNCCDWVINGYNYIAEESKPLETTRGIRFRNIYFNFKTGEFKHKAIRDKNKCCMCGEPLNEHNRVGRYCRSCLISSRGLAYRFGYHDYQDGYPTPAKVDTTKVPVFGCEIERDYRSSSNKSGGDFGEALRRAMVEIIKETQGDQLEKGTLKREQVFMSDGSLTNGGMEWITFPHTFDWYIKNQDKLDRAIKAIKHYGFTSTSYAGNHIHMNRDFFTTKRGKVDAKFCAGKIAVLINKFWNEFCLIANRKNTRYTNKPSQECTDDLWEICEKTLRDQHEHSVAVNLQHSATIEIRLWGAIKDAGELLFYLDNMQALARFVKVSSLEKVQRAKFTDFMKYYKLPTSINRVKLRLKKIQGSETYEDVCNLLEEKRIEKRGNR